MSVDSSRRRGLVAAISVATTAGVGISMLYPLLALALERMGAKTTTIGVMATVGSIATLAITPVIPRLMQRVGTLPLLVGSVGVAIACTLLFNAWPDVWVWFPLRFVNSAALILLFVVSEIWINQLAEDHNRGRVLGVYVTCFSAGGAAGPALLFAVGTDGWLPYVVTAVVMGFSALPLAFARDVVPRFDHAPSMGFGYFLAAAPIAGLAALAYGAVETSVLHLLPVYAVRNAYSAESAAFLLSLYGLGNVILQLPIGWLSDRVDRRRLLLGCAAMGAVGGVALPGLIERPGLLEPLLVLWGGVVVGMYTIGLAMLSERFRGPDLAAANSAFIFLYGLGMLTGPTMAGVAMDIWDPHGLGGVVAVIFGVYVLVGGWFLLRESRSQGTGGAAR